MDEQFIQTQILTLKRCHDLWVTLAAPSISEDLTPYGLPGMSRASITNSFLMLVSRLEKTNVEDLEATNPFLIQTIAQNFPSWSGPIEGWINSVPSNPAGHLPNLVSHLNTMWSQLNLYEIQVSLPELQKAADEVESLNSQSAVLLKEMVGNSTSLEAKKIEIIGQCEEILKKAEESLAAAARTGLAASFSNRSSEYDWPRRGWFFVFISSLIGLVLVSVNFIYPTLNTLNGVDRLLHLITELPLTLPFIWLSWFSALRFSQLGRFKEDYKFKVAAALALDGYRKQAEDISPALLEKLLDIAITNFGENPLRLMTRDSAKDAHPLAGLLDEKLIKEVFVSAIKSSNKNNT